MNWSLRGCARQGHATFAPDEALLRDRLRAETAVGEAWRCLRCETFVVGPPHGRGPADTAPIVLRGKALREAFILRILAVERWIRAVILALLAAAVFTFESTQTSLQAWFDRELPRFRPLAEQFNYNLDKSPTIGHIRSLLNSRHGTLHLVEAFLIGYALLQLAEGIGLWSLKRWGEYVAAIGTSVFLPLEIYELTKEVTLLKVGALVINLALVVYLVSRKRLFGVRGGRAAFERERHEDSLLEVEAAAAGTSPAATT
ncbi:MAG: hypothetical protein QOJ03_2516 [Frankiaceae bacterium]|jgi:uncharacterized membrane protein (DUF2068 family)|nr:hypothetical protein [Frankiaceae bacterium]